MVVDWNQAKRGRRPLGQHSGSTCDECRERRALRTAWLTLSLLFCWMIAFSVSAAEPPENWPWSCWERSGAGIERWPQLDGDPYQAFRQGARAAKPRLDAGSPLAGRPDGAAPKPAVYLLLNSPASNDERPPAKIELPRLDNVVERVWWWPLTVQAELSGGGQVAGESACAEPSPRVGSAYRMPFVPPVERLLELKQTPSQWTIGLSAGLQQTLRTQPVVVVLDVRGEPVWNSEPEVVLASADRSLVLPASKAKVHGTKLQFEPLPHKNTVGFWIDAADWATWRFQVGSSGRYRVEALIGCGAGQGGSQVEFRVADIPLVMTVEETGHFQNFRRRVLGEVDLSAEAVQAVTVRCVRKAKAAVMDLREVRFIPIVREEETAAVGRETTSARDVRLIPPDVVLPPLTHQSPAPGRRCLRRLAEFAADDVYHTLTLPTDWVTGRAYPVLVEWTGNGPFLNAAGDVCTGRVEDAGLAYGLSGGDGAIVLSLPYLNDAGTANVTQWWGDPPRYQPQPTLRYAAGAIREVCAQFGGDARRVVLVGFSRGAIACNALGLHDDAIAKQWRGMICFSHYEGVRPWPPTQDGKTAERLARLGDCPQLILSESPRGGATSLVAEVRQYLERSQVAGDFQYLETGFFNHSDLWALCPNPTREEVRRRLTVWLQSTASTP
jgi:hypothetical protein